jgi:hypothetical protein
MHPFTKYASYTCEWAMRENLCKHQLVIIFIVTNVTQEDVIEYCETWYGYNRNGLLTMFVDPKHIINGLNFKDDGFAYDCDEGVIDISGVEPMDESLPPTNDGGACVELVSSIVSLDRIFVCLHHTMQEITEECNLGGVALSNHAYSFLIVVASNIRNIHVAKVNASLYLELKLHHVNDGLGNFVRRLKDWHEAMLSHSFLRKRRTHE